MAARTKTKVTPKYKTKYRVKNWAAYDIALRERGDLTVWFDEEAVCSWNALPSGRPGGQRMYSDLAMKNWAAYDIALRDSGPGATISLAR